MWTWLKRVFAAVLSPAPVAPAPEQAPPTEQPAAPVDDGGLFSPEEVLIYRHAVSYTDDGFVFAVKDPVYLWRRMMNHGTEISNAIKVAYSPSKFAADARDRLVARLREVFEIPLPEEGGLSETHLTQLLTHFLAYAETVKKNLPPPSTFQRATSPPTTPYAEEGEGQPPDTGTSSDSGSTVNGTSSGSPAASPSEPESPTESSSQGWSTTVPSRTATGKQK